MENDDDLFVVIIGDDSEKKLHDTAIEHGEVFVFDGENFNLIDDDTDNSQSKIKSEYNDDEYGENIEDYVPSDHDQSVDDEDYIPCDHFLESSSYDDVIDTNDKKCSTKSTKDHNQSVDDEDYIPSDHSVDSSSDDDVIDTNDKKCSTKSTKDHDQSVDDEDYIPSDHSLEASSDGDVIDTNDKKCSTKSTNKNAQQKNNTTERDMKNTHFWKSKPRKIISHVKHLQSQYPELKEDVKELINRLVEIMKQTHRPDPPKDYYVMNGIKLECVHCSALSATIPAAQKHYQEKHGERYLFCYACGADFRSTSILYKHEKRCEAPDIKIVLKARAIWLGRKGRSRPFIPDFSKLPPKRYDCTECSANFASKYDLLAHERMHRGERPYRCTHCPRAYTSNAALSRHMQKHSSHEYVCDHCGRSFKVRATFIVHLDTHAPVKKFPCLECNKRYSKKAALQLHVHRDHRRLPLPFACQICPKRYPRMSVLKEHTKKVHGLLILTPKLFSKQLPVLRNTQLQKAMVVLKTANKLTDHRDDDC